LSYRLEVYAGASLMAHIGHDPLQADEAAKIRADFL
jgi:hypothetical protein